MTRSYLPKPQVLEFKRGDTVTLGCAALDEAGAAVDLTGVVIAAQMRDAAGELTCEMDLVPVDLALGTYSLWVPTGAEPAVGEHTIDIQYTDTSGPRALVRSSDTFYVRILQDITQ